MQIREKRSASYFLYKKLSLFFVLICTFSIIGIYSIKTVHAAPLDTDFIDPNLYICIIEALNAEAINGVTDRDTINDNYETNDDELGKLTYLNCGATGHSEENKISDMTGFQKLTGLVEVELFRNNITSIDFSKNIALKSIIIGNNHIESLDLSKNTNIETVIASFNDLSNIDISGCTKLKELDLEYNNLTEINLQNNNELIIASLDHNLLTSLDISNTDNLLDLYANNNRLSSLTLNSVINPDAYVESYYYLGNNSDLATVNIKSDNSYSVYQNKNISKIMPGTTVSNVNMFLLAYIYKAFLYNSSYTVDTWDITYTGDDAHPPLTYVAKDHDANIISGSTIVKTGDLISATYAGADASDIRIAVSGDVVPDGQITIGDVVKLYRHQRGKDIMTDEVLLAAGDTVPDGQITIGDVVKLYRFQRGRIDSL